MIPIDNHFDEAFASQLAELESYNKHYYRPNSYLHKWWARRCGSTFRLILKGLVAEETQQDYYAPGGLAGTTILDPMMGGGTTLHEAIRLGANVIGADLDPIPILQVRATLSQIPLPELEKAYKHFYKSLRTALDVCFQTTYPESGQSVPLRFVIYGARRFWAEKAVIVVDSLILRIEKDGALIQLCAACHQIIQAKQTHHCQPPENMEPLLEKGDRWGRGRRSPIEDDLDVPYWRRYMPLVIVGQVPKSRQLFFKQPDAADLALLAQADAQRPSLPFSAADFCVDHGRKSRQLHLHGVENYLDLFSSRQLLYLQKAIELLPQFEPKIRLNLALLVSTSLEFNSMLCGYKGKNKRRAGAIRHTFSHHAYSFPHTAVENNPLHPHKASGTLQRLYYTRIHNGRVWALAPRERQLSHDRTTFVEISGETDTGTERQTQADLHPHKTQQFLLRQGSSAYLDLANESVDFIVTDPPYFDSVQYSDLATFFRVWLKQLLPEGADWDYDRQLSAVDPHHLDRESRYTQILSQIFSESARVLKKENGRFIFTFHHWNPKAWSALTIALQRANFQLVTHYVVLSENHINVHISGMKALLHDVIFVCAPQGNGRVPPVSRPDTITMNDSEQFCRDCGALLGFQLYTNMPENEIQTMWQQAIP